METMTVGIYAGSFDPITNGHLDIIQRSLKFCDKLIVAIGVNPAKQTMFTEAERRDFIHRAYTSFKVEAVVFQGLLIEYAKKVEAKVLIRGIRSVSDFEYEINLANVNKVLEPDIETVFLPTSPELAVVSSSMVKEIAKHGGNIKPFVPSHVATAIESKFGFLKTGS